MNIRQLTVPVVASAVVIQSSKYKTVDSTCGCVCCSNVGLCSTFGEASTVNATTSPWNKIYIYPFLMNSWILVFFCLYDQENRHQEQINIIRYKKKSCFYQKCRNNTASTSVSCLFELWNKVHHLTLDSDEFLMNSWIPNSRSFWTNKIGLILLKIHTN